MGAAMKALLAACLIFSITAVSAETLVDHFLAGECRTDAQPTLIVADVTRAGEIDDSISLMMYRELERRGCIDVIGVVSIFGNGGSSTANVHKNLLQRLDELGFEAWKPLVLRGPDRKSFGVVSPRDHERLTMVAHIIKRHRSVVIVELGPLTISSRLLMHGMVQPETIERILGIGGRVAGERFATGRKLGVLFGFRDMNIDEDTNAVSYLLRHHPGKLWMVTYQTGLGARTVTSDMVGAHAPLLADHARRRARILQKLLGYQGIPSWDTWTTRYFLVGGAESLACGPTRAGMRYADQSFRDPMQLWLDLPEGHMITACR